MNSVTPPQSSWYRSTLPTALIGSLLLWAALPPLSLGWLGWIAPIPWLLLIQKESLPGRRPYGALYLAGFAFWMMSIHWLRLPHPATSLGWIALSGYLAFYLPVFVGLSRVAVHPVGVPLWLAAPIVWTGLELARAHLLTGFLMASLAHTQVRWTQLIQISDVVGEYGVDVVIMLVAACIVSVFRISDFGLPAAAGNPKSVDRRVSIHPLAILPAVLLLAATLIYGHFRLAESQRIDAGEANTVRIALIQGNSLAEWKFDPSRERQIMDEYLKLSDEAVATAARNGRPIDLLVWPETMFRTGLVTFDADFHLPAGVPNTKQEIAAIGPSDLASLVKRLGTPVFVGIDRAHYDASAKPDAEPPRPHRYNSAALVGREGTIIGTYDKIHRVMFGEYIPFAEYLPFLYRLTPLTGGIDAGREPVVFGLNGHFYAPSICYETVIPHVMRRQARALAGGSVPADVLINVTNDAWYWGSSELDQHLACGVFRAVEARRPLVIAANGGISAWIDRTGVVRAQSPRQQPDVILANVELGHMRSLYVELGDWFAVVCLTCCVLLAIIGWRSRRVPQ
ncbi:MAG: apolipoprotein N-acyltransferase [Planctomycetes bacterium]|nr:apolipoprotein N-acyltransferase [Planctomycetota bacterium]